MMTSWCAFLPTPYEKKTISVANLNHFPKLAEQKRPANLQTTPQLCLESLPSKLHLKNNLFKSGALEISCC